MIEERIVYDVGMCVGVKYYPWPHVFSEEARTKGVSKRIPHKAITLITPGRTRMAFAHPRAIIRVAKHSLFDLAMELVNEHLVGTELEPEPEIKAELISRWIVSPDADREDWKLAYIHEYLIEWQQADDAEDEIVRNRLGMPRLLAYAEERGDLERISEKYGIRFSTACPLSQGEDVDCDECPYKKASEGLPCAEPGLGWFGWTTITGKEWEVGSGPEEVPDDLKGLGLVPVRTVYPDEEAPDEEKAQS